MIAGVSYSSTSQHVTVAPFTEQAASPAAVEAFPGRWWLAHTKPRQEKALVDDLTRRGISCFLPLAKVRRRYSDRTVDIHLPLFPSYLFFSGQERDRLATFETRRVANVIAIADQASLKAELSSINRAMKSQELIDLYPGIRRGRRVRVIRGTLRGVEGVVIKRRSSCRVYLGVEMLGQSAHVEVDPSSLEPID
jgi:transcription antitermination factor NusG